MPKKTIGSIALVAALLLFVQFFAPSALAQNYKGAPKPTIQDYGPFTNSPTNKIRASDSSAKLAPGQCGNPAGSCDFYGGNFLVNLLGPNVSNGLANENTLFVGGTPYGAATWVPFIVPTGQTWTVTGLFTNNFMSYGVLDQTPNTPTQAAYWAINTSVLPGNGGTQVASGVAAATSTPTGRSDFNLQEFTIEVQGLSVTLASGEYWMAVVPYCTNTANPYCGSVSFLSDVEYINRRPHSAIGVAEPGDNSFFDSSVFGVTFSMTNGPLGSCGGLGCDAFSAGVIGTKQ